MGGRENLPLACRRAPERKKKKDQSPSSSLQKNGSGVKKFGFKNNHTPENVPLVPKFGLERWGGSQTKTKGEVPCLTLP
jgi:hypothetical protein